MNDIKIVENYKDNNELRNAFNEFAGKIFSGLSLEKWYKSGYWTDKYIPYSLTKGNCIISNVSISKMNIVLDGKQVKGIQFGTVGTLPEYRKQGLSKYLMDHVLNKYENSTDLFFLFANDTVLEFYPKFGFQRVIESIYKLESAIPIPNFSVRKLNINNDTDFSLIKDLLEKRLILTSIFGATDYQFITIWHLIYVFYDNIYYLEDENIIFIQTIKQNQLHLWDIIFSKPFNFKGILPKIIQDGNIESIYFYFPPDQIKYKYDEVLEDKNSMFFMKENFPLKGNQFKFPTTAQT